jgi:L-fucose isomerase-like protein
MNTKSDTTIAEWQGRASAGTGLKLGVVLLGRKRPGFDQNWGGRIEEEIRRDLPTLPFSSAMSGTRVIDDATLRAALEGLRADGCNVLALVQATMADGRLAPIFAQQWGDPIVLWATPENPEGNMISSCSLVGAHTFAATLRQLGHPFELAYAGVHAELGLVPVTDAVRRAYAVSRLKKAKAGLIGHHAPGFIDMQADAGDLSRQLGVQLYHAGLRELTEAMDALPEDFVREDMESFGRLGLPLDGVEAEALMLQSRYYLALRGMMETESLDCLTVRCWPELPSQTGQWPYLALVRLCSKGLPCSMEGDLDGSITCLLGELLGIGSGFLSDWLEHSGDTITLWHPGNATFNLSKPVGDPCGPRITRHFNNRLPAVVASELLENHPITIARLWRCDNRYLLTARNAVTVPVKRDFQGTHALAHFEKAGVFEWFEDLCHHGMPHHVAVFPGHHAGQFLKLHRNLALTVVE